MAPKYIRQYDKLKRRAEKEGRLQKWLENMAKAMDDIEANPLCKGNSADRKFFLQEYLVFKHMWPREEFEGVDPNPPKPKGAKPAAAAQHVDQSGGETKSKPGVTAGKGQGKPAVPNVPGNSDKGKKSESKPSDAKTSKSAPAGNKPANGPPKTTTTGQPSATRAGKFASQDVRLENDPHRFERPREGGSQSWAEMAADAPTPEGDDWSLVGPKKKPAKPQAKQDDKKRDYNVYAPLLGTQEKTKLPYYSVISKHHLTRKLFLEGKAGIADHEKYMSGKLVLWGPNASGECFLWAEPKSMKFWETNPRSAHNACEALHELLWHWVQHLEERHDGKGKPPRKLDIGQYKNHHNRQMRDFPEAMQEVRRPAAVHPPFPVPRPHNLERDGPVTMTPTRREGTVGFLQFAANNGAEVGHLIEHLRNANIGDDAAAPYAANPLDPAAAAILRSCYDANLSNLNTSIADSRNSLAKLRAEFKDPSTSAERRLELSDLIEGIEERIQNSEARKEQLQELRRSRQGPPPSTCFVRDFSLLLFWFYCHSCSDRAQNPIQGFPSRDLTHQRLLMPIQGLIAPASTHAHPGTHRPCA
ncbi:hypothetical protein N431DRAFT_467255 [Stipitochalara longipes BDJ]|nr:hypothetical protein N431DRAFT_467255 [Stipitochalara longipes BDJ]